MAFGKRAELRLTCLELQGWAARRDGLGVLGSSHVLLVLPCLFAVPGAGLHALLSGRRQWSDRQDAQLAVSHMVCFAESA